MYVIVDIDGTIALNGERVKHLQEQPPNWDDYYARCAEDKPNVPVCDLVHQLNKMYTVIFCSGRRESCRKDTVMWIERYISHWEAGCLILLRGDKDYRHDTEIKPELLMNAGIELHEIAFVLEDRNSMVKKWRELGLTCLQVAEGDF